MAEFRISSNVSPISQNIGEGTAYVNDIRSRINKKIGGVYTLCTEYRNDNLLYNPMTLRYRNHENASSTAGGSDIGVIYRVEDKKDIHDFLDEETGLVGFTFGDESTSPGHENIKNTGVQRNFEEVKHHQGEFFTDNYKFLYDVDQHESVENPYLYIEKLNRLDKIYPGQNYYLYNNLSPEQGVLQKIDEAIFMAQQTMFERNNTIVTQRYLTNGGGFKFDSEYNTDFGRHHAFIKRDVSGLKNRITQLYFDVFGVSNYGNINIHNRFMRTIMYNPSLPLNQGSVEYYDFKRYNPIEKLSESGHYDLYSVGGDETYRSNEIFYDGEISNGRVTNMTIDNLDRVFDASNDIREESIARNEYNVINNEPYKRGRYPNLSTEEYSTNDKTYYNGGGYSIDNPNYENDYGKTKETTRSNESNRESSTYSLFDEPDVKVSDGERTYNNFVSGKGNGEQTNWDKNTSVALLNDEEDNNGNGLLAKTNELFRRGKINSLINRFKTGEESSSLIQSSVDSKYGLSRGRNLRKASDPTTHNGYENPWCRVWTSHYQYSKFSDLIRHSGYDEKKFQSDGKLRPRYSKNSLFKYSSLQDNGLPLIAPYSNDDGVLDKESIKRCMFSIENLAWKDLTVKKDDENLLLREEQKGPNGGRIMWFPPYNLTFNENVNVNWASNSFIGRGEQIYTYTNTERGGTLSFNLLIDHPSVLDNWSADKEYNGENEQKILQFFAGCDDGSIRETAQLKIKTVEKKSNINLTTTDYNSEFDVINTPKLEVEMADVKLRFFVFFPNDFSGIDYMNDINVPIKYLLTGDEQGVNGYEMALGEPIKGCIKEKTIKGKNGTWKYQVDKIYVNEALLAGNYEDKNSFGLNSATFPEILTGDDTEEKQKIVSILNLNEADLKYIRSFDSFSNTDFRKLSTFYGNDIEGAVTDDEYDLIFDIRGYASSQGYHQNNVGEGVVGNSSEVSYTMADAKAKEAIAAAGLSGNRARVIARYIQMLNLTSSDKIRILKKGEIPVDNKDVSSIEAKLGRCAEIIVTLHKKDKEPRMDRTKEDSDVNSEDLMQGINIQEIDETETIGYDDIQAVVETDDYYDNEYVYFKKVNETDDLVKRNIVEKVKYFDPAFHSITPEGFNGRLTFLHQCTRQGPTMSITDVNGNRTYTAGNLAFGRPPVCVLRIGDFYNTKIIIDSLTINYDNNGVQWDLNPEGVGIQPMLARVDITFKFLGGSDLSGPIARLQNAVSYNYYANTSAYDNRADYRENYIDRNNDTAEAWNPWINEHKPFTTINDTINDKD